MDRNPALPDRNSLQQQVKFYESILNNIHHGVVITDERGKIIFFSDTYGKFLGLNPAEVIGKHCTEVIENTRMHLVAQSRVAEINHSQRIKDQDMVVQRIPIVTEDGTLFVFGQVMFKDVKDVHTLAKRLNLLETKVALYEKELTSLRSSKYTFDHIAGDSRHITEVKNQAQKAAQTNAPVLLMGESGTGKELFAHAIHFASSRRIHPFIRINCSAIPRELLEAELFGYEPGAFTGAGNKGKPGKFELAQGGSIFLDEISDLPLEVQPKLLRVLEEKELERLGGTRLTKLDFRLIAATNRDLGQLVEEGRFRKDLYYRLNVIPLQIPPIRERREDIPQISRYLIEKFHSEQATRRVEITPEVMEVFKKYPWPGNVRELSNVLERILYTIDGNEIGLRHLPVYLQNVNGDKESRTEIRLKYLNLETEKEAILHCLRLAGNNKNEAARLLGIHRTGLYKKMRKMCIPLSGTG